MSADDIRAAILAECAPAPTPSMKGRSPEAAARKRRADRDRMRRKRADARAEREAQERTDASLASPHAEPERDLPAGPRRPSSGDGRVLGVYGLSRPSTPGPAIEVYYSRDGSATLPPTYRDQGDYLRSPRAEPERPATIRAPGLSLSFFRSDGASEVARIAERAGEALDLPPSKINELRERVSQLRPGETLDLCPPVEA